MNKFTKIRGHLLFDNQMVYKSTIKTMKQASVNFRCLHIVISDWLLFVDLHN